MENKSKSTLEEEFDKFFQEPQTQPSHQQSQSTPPTDLKQDSAETRTDPNRWQYTRERPWIEDVWVRVYDRTDKEGVEIPPDADFVVVSHSADSVVCRVTALLEKAVKTFPEVEQLVTELWETHRYVDSFNLHGNDPRLEQLAAKLGLVRLPTDHQSKGAA